MRGAAVGAIVLLAVMAAGLGQGEHSPTNLRCECEDFCLNTFEITPGRPEGTIYLDGRGHFGIDDGVWIYAETNGVWAAKPAGVYHYANWATHTSLQRGGPPVAPVGGEYCVDAPEVAPDLLLFAQ